MAFKGREVAGGASSRWLMTVVCRVEVTFVTIVECTVCCADSELVDSERMLLLNLGLEVSRMLVVWVVTGKGGGGGTGGTLGPGLRE